MDGSSEPIQSWGVHGDLHAVVQIAVFHFAEQSEELVIGEPFERLEIREPILAKVSGVENPPEFARNTNG